MALLSSLRSGESALITCLPFDVKLASRLREMGLLIGTRIAFVRSAPMGDPLEFRLRGVELSIRRDDAAQVHIEESTRMMGMPKANPTSAILALPSSEPTLALPEYHPEEVFAKSYAVVGNPNCGKTTLFNALTGMRQKVGNYPGVTVEKKSGQFIGQHGARQLQSERPCARRARHPRCPARTPPRYAAS